MEDMENYGYTLFRTIPDCVSMKTLPTRRNEQYATKKGAREVRLYGGDNSRAGYFLLRYSSARLSPSSFARSSALRASSGLPNSCRAMPKSRNPSA